MDFDGLPELEHTREAEERGEKKHCVTSSTHLNILKYRERKLQLGRCVNQGRVL